MKNKIKSLLLASVILVFSSCISTKSTLKNVDDNAPIPTLTKDNTFLINAYSKDKKYGYDKDYPINVFYKNTKDENLNARRFLDALSGPKGEKIKYTKLESCCPFPSKKATVGAGFLDIYEISWEGQKESIKLYVNIYEKGYLLVPIGLSIKNNTL